MSLPDTYRKPEKGDGFPALSLSRSLMESLTELRVKLAARSPRHFSVSAPHTAGVTSICGHAFFINGNLCLFSSLLAYIYFENNEFSYYIPYPI